MTRLQEYTFVRTNQQNIHLLIPLFFEVFGQKVSREYLIQKYTTFLTKEDQYYGFMALDRDGLAVSHQAVIPAKLQFGEKEFLGAHSCDSMTSQLHNGKGLFRELVERIFELLKQNGFEFFFGFTNQNSMPIFNQKFACKYLHTMNGYTIKVRTLPIEKICRKLGFPYLSYLAWVDFAFRWNHINEVIPNSCIDQHNGGIIHDEAFFAYKCFSFNRRIKLEGVNLWFKLQGPLSIGDIGTASESEVLRMLKKLKRKCFWLGIDEIIFQASPGTHNDSIFAKNFTGFPSWVILCLDFSSGLDFDRLKLTLGDLDSF